MGKPRRHPLLFWAEKDALSLSLCRWWLPRHVSFEELDASERFYCSQNRFLRLLLACYHFVAAHSDLLCYFVIVLNNMVSASAISVVLPILVFLWAMLSIPRPSKRFWMTAIVYTEVGASPGPWPPSSTFGDRLPGRKTSAGGGGIVQIGNWV